MRFKHLSICQRAPNHFLTALPRRQICDTYSRADHCIRLDGSAQDTLAKTVIMDSSFDASVTQWIDNLKRGDDEAARQLWQRYFQRLVGVARNKLGAAPRRVADEEDVALNAFAALCRGAADGRFQQLADRDDLWHLMVAITAKEAVDQMRREGRQKRGGGEVRGNSVFAGQGPEIPNGFDQILLEAPTPEFLVMLQEQHARLLRGLRDPTLRQVAIHRMEGYSNEEIADKLEISLRSVERKLKLIRDEWSQEIQD